MNDATRGMTCIYCDEMIDGPNELHAGEPMHPECYRAFGNELERIERIERIEQIERNKQTLDCESCGFPIEDGDEIWCCGHITTHLRCKLDYLIVASLGLYPDKPTCGQRLLIVGNSLLDVIYGTR